MDHVAAKHDSNAIDTKQCLSNSSSVLLKNDENIKSGLSNELGEILKEENMATNQQSYLVNFEQEFSIPLEPYTLKSYPLGDTIISNEVNSRSKSYGDNSTPLKSALLEEECKTIETCESRTSLGTICYGTYESPKYSKKSKNRLTEGGILLDANLIGSKPAKRKCATKTERFEKPKKKDTKKKATFSQLIDLPVQEITSKVLSWKTKNLAPTLHDVIPNEKCVVSFDDSLIFCNEDINFILDSKNY